MNGVHFILCDIKEDLCQEWSRYIEYYKLDKSLFTIFHGKMDEYKGTFDCIVSPANVFGKLDGSFDLVISKMFSPNDYNISVDYVQDILHNNFNGFQPTGTSIMIPMNQFPNKYNCHLLAHTPTMRQPSNITWNKEIVYTCMYSLLNSIVLHKRRNDSKLEKVFITGLGTGIGRYPAAVCAGQMLLAYSHFIENLNKNSSRTEWSEIVRKGMDLEELNRSNAFV
jgi:O-acetyl-ADP-ribose deacetylase (regulator of RNase III)